MKGLNTLFSNESTEWITPPGLFSNIRDAFDIRLDPCAHDTELLPVEMSLNRKHDGLTQDWNYNTYINPPYSDIETWVDKTIMESIKHPKNSYVMLLPSRTDRTWFRKVLGAACAVCFISKRLRFSNAKNNAPFPSIIAVFTGNEHLTDEQFRFMERNGYVI